MVFALAAHALAGFWTQSPLTLLVVGVVAVLGGASAVVWALRPLRTRHSDRHLARFVEERVPSLDDRLVTAVDVATAGAPTGAQPLTDALLADASRRVEAVDLDQVVPAATVRSTTLQASAAMLV